MAAGGGIGYESSSERRLGKVSNTPAHETIPASPGPRSNQKKDVLRSNQKFPRRKRYIGRPFPWEKEDLWNWWGTTLDLELREKN